MMNSEYSADLILLCESEIFGVCVCVCLCVCCHLVCGFVQQASAEEDLLSVALTPLQMSHSSPPFLLCGGENERWKV